MNRAVLFHQIGEAGTFSKRFFKADLDFLKEQCEGDLTQLLGSVIDQCIKYAESVVEFLEIQMRSNGEVTDEYREIDSRRHVIHSATEDSIKALARNMTRMGKNGSWIKDLPHRAACGKFAIQIAYQTLKKEAPHE